MTGHAVHPANLNLLSALEPAVSYRPRPVSAACSHGTGRSSIVGPARAGVTVTPKRKVTADSPPTRPSLYFALKQTMS